MLAVLIFTAKRASKAHRHTLVQMLKSARASAFQATQRHWARAQEYGTCPFSQVHIYTQSRKVKCARARAQNLRTFALGFANKNALSISANDGIFKKWEPIFYVSPDSANAFKVWT